MRLRQLRAMIVRLGGAYGSGGARDRDFAEELEAHLRMHVEDNVRAGMTPREARRQALIKLGGIAQTKEAYRRRRGIPVLEDLWQDLRYGARVLRKSPVFTLAAVTTLAVGIGANAAIFSVVNAVLLRPLAYMDSERLVLINHNYQKLNIKATVSAPGYLYYREHAHSFSVVAAATSWYANMTGEGEPERLQGMLVTPNLFPALGARAALGRVPVEEEGRAGCNRVVVLSHALWQRRFGGDPSAVNRSITLNGSQYTIVGVMPPGFQFGREFGPPADFWAPIAFATEQLSSGNLTKEYLTVVARLSPGISLTQAQAELDSIAGRLREQYMPGSDEARWGLLARPMRELVVGDIRLALLLILGAVTIVLLVACANVANLTLARAAFRQKEFAIRAALGAERKRMVRQLLTESTLVALAGGAAGLLLAGLSLSFLIKMNENKFPRAYEIGLDWRVVSFTAAVSLLTGLAFGLGPAFQASRANLHDTLKEGGRGGSAGVRRGVRGALVVAEVSLAVVLLIGAGLLVRSFVSLRHVNPGFQPQHVLAMQLSLPGKRYPEPRQRADFYRRALEVVRAMPGVSAVGAISALPMSGDNLSASFAIEGRTISPREPMPHGDRLAATPEYFVTMGIPLVRGRFFNERDTADAPGAVIIDETLARKYWPNEDPVGKRISLDSNAGEPKWHEVVGVVGHVRHAGLEGESAAQYYLPHSQSPDSSMFVVARSEGDPSALAGPVRDAIRALDSDLPLYRVTTMERLVADSLGQRRFSMLLLGFFAGAALLLALIGLYGLLSYTVEQRRHEIGVRMALGARTADVVRLVVGQGLWLAIAGVSLGLAGALALTHLMSGLLYGVSSVDPATFVGVALLLLSVALAACLIPALRATKVDPTIALRSE